MALQRGDIPAPGLKGLAHDDEDAEHGGRSTAAAAIAITGDRHCRQDTQYAIKLRQSFIDLRADMDMLAAKQEIQSYQRAIADLEEGTANSLDKASSTMHGTTRMPPSSPHDDTGSNGCSSDEEDLNPLEVIYDSVEYLMKEERMVSVSKLIQIANKKGLDSDTINEALSRWVVLGVMQIEGNHVTMQDHPT